MEKQNRICCYFQSRECEDEEHGSCGHIYEGLNIEATCNCKCHRDIRQLKIDDFVDIKFEERKQLPAVDSKTAEGQTVLDDFFGVVNNICTKKLK